MVTGRSWPRGAARLPAVPAFRRQAVLQWDYTYRDLIVVDGKTLPATLANHSIHSDIEVSSA